MQIGDYVTSADFNGPTPIAMVRAFKPNLGEMRAIIGRKSDASYPVGRLVVVPLLPAPKVPA